MFELYHFHGATCGLKARLAVAEKQVSLLERAVDRAYLRTPEYRALNPNGVVPTLVHDAEVLTESTVIINYLDDACEGPPLKPAAPAGAARALWWMKRADDLLQYIGILTYTVSMRPALLVLGPEELRAYLDAIPNAAARARRGRIIELGYGNPDFAVAAASLSSMLDDMEAALSERTWLASGDYGLGDIAMTPLLERLAELGCAGLWTQDRPSLSRWWDEVRSRPSYDACVLRQPNPEAAQHRRHGEQAWPDVQAAFRSG